MAADSPEQWLNWYGGSRYDWQTVKAGHGRTVFARRIGIVESFFDHDGTDFVGRADMHCLLSSEVQSNLSNVDLQTRFISAWAVLRARHPLLRARAVDAEADPILWSTSLTDRCFVIDEPISEQSLVDEARDSIVFLQDHGYENVSPKDFYRHSMNTARIFDPSKAMSKLFVLPVQKLSDGKDYMHTVTVFAHQISDGLSANSCNSELLDLINQIEEELYQALRPCCFSNYVQANLPPAQEAIYHTLGTNTPSSRWLWAISRVLRHKRKPPKDAFQNPLKRSEPLPPASLHLEPKYDKVLDYSVIPPLRSFVGFVDLAPDTTRNVIRLCREANASVGSGLFTLVGMAMMELEEQKNPSVPLDKRPAFVASFPLNIRPFLNYSKSPDSIMLGFSDGISLPFLSSDLPAEGRFKVLVRQAHRQLRVYQKRRDRSAKDEARLGSKNPAFLIPILYLFQIEVRQKKLNRSPAFSPQGDLPAAASNTGATNGVSSVGNRSSIIRAGKHALDGSKDFAADFRDLACSVRARDGEFLCAAQGDGDVLRFHVAYDGNSVDEAKFDLWREKMETLLQPKVDPKL